MLGDRTGKVGKTFGVLPGTITLGVQCHVSRGRDSLGLGVRGVRIKWRRQLRIDMYFGL